MSLPAWTEIEIDHGPNANPEILPPMPRDVRVVVLPADIQAELQRLLTIKEKVLKMGWRMDGVLFGWIGLDPFLSLIPVLGDVASSSIKAYFLHQAHQARAPSSVMLKIGFFTLVDLSFAALPGIGDLIDVFFRSHAWSAQAVAQHIDAQLARVEEVRAMIENGAAPELEWQRLRTALLC